jgi:16S rRNA processing protein RimM
VDEPARDPAARENPVVEYRYIALGRILRPHGVRGEVVVEVLTDFPERLAHLPQVYLGDAHQATLTRVRSCRIKGDVMLMAFEACPDRTAAEALRDQLVQVPLDEAAPLPEDTYYPHQLVGLDVETTAGDDLGRLSDVLFTPANDVYVVTGPRGQVLLPAIRQVIKQIDLAAGRMVVELIPGLVD